MNAKEVIIKHLGIQTRMIAGSKTGYIKTFPEMKPVFNGQIGTKEEGIVWRGDVDLVADSEILMRISDELQQTLYICTESAFFNRPYTIQTMMDVAVGKVYPQSKIRFDERV